MPSLLAKRLAQGSSKAAGKKAAVRARRRTRRKPKRESSRAPSLEAALDLLDAKLTAKKDDDGEEVYDGPALELNPISEQDAGDPRIYADIVESILDEAMRPGTRLKGTRASAMIAAIEIACEILTDSTLKEAKRKRQNPVENLRDVMARADELAAKIEASYQSIDALRPIAAEKCEYAVPSYPPRCSAEADGDLTAEAAHRFAEAKKQFSRVLGALNNMLRGLSTGLQTKQLLTLINTACQTTVGEDLSVVAREATDAMRRVTDLLATPEADINVIRDSYRHAEGATGWEMNAWDKICDRVIALQRAAWSDSAKLAAYAGRDADPARAGELLEIQWFQVAFHDLRALPDQPNVLIHAHPGTGKTTHFRIGRAGLIGRQPERRMLLLLADKDVAGEEVDALRRFMKTGYYRAVYPNIRILGRVDKARENGGRFSVARKNQEYARDPTVSGYGATCNVEGKGYDDVEIDDPQPDIAKYREDIRKTVTRNVEGSVSSRLRVAADSHIRAICTPKHAEDWAGRIRRRSGAGQLPSWKVVVSPFAVHQDPVTGKFIPLWPKVVTAQQLQEKSHSDSFANDYLLRDDAATNTIVSHLCYYPADADDPLWDRVAPEDRAKALAYLKVIRAGQQWISIDPSGTRNKRSAKTAVGRFSLTAGNHLYLLRVDFRPGDPVALREWVIRQITGDELFAARFIRDEDDEATKVAKRALWNRHVPAAGNLAGVVIEETGAQSFGTSAFKHDVPARVREMGIEWDGSMKGFVATKLLGNKTNIGKSVRLREVAHMFTRRYISFPGKWRMDFDGENLRDLTCMDNGPQCGETATLAEQILHFDEHRTNDGVDMVTQILLFLAKRGLERDIPAMVAAATKGGFVDEFKEAFRKCMDDLGKDPEPENPEKEELEWCRQAFSAA